MFICLFVFVFLLLFSVTLLFLCDKYELCYHQVKALPGLGTTIDVILVNGKLREGDTLVLPGIEGPIVTQIRALLTPQPLKELRVKNQYITHKELRAAQGVKIAAKDLEKALAGVPIMVAEKEDEIDYCKVYPSSHFPSFFSILVEWCYIKSVFIIFYLAVV